MPHLLTMTAMLRTISGDRPGAESVCPAPCHDGDMTSLAQSERAALCATFDALGPDSPTLCEGWTNRDLAVHLRVRESRPDAAAGMLLKPLAGHQRSVEQQIGSTPWPDLVEQIRQGPPRWSPFQIGAVDELANTAEFFVHHEDALRGADPTARRDPSPEMEDALWGALGRMGRVLLRRSPVGVDVRCAGQKERPLTRAGQGDGRVTLTGRTSEALLRTFGRGVDDPRVVDVEIDGEPEAVAQFAAYSPGF